MIAQCTVDYLGRLTAHLPSARRLLLIKADGSVSVHADDRAYKPLNWMSPPCWLTDDDSGVYVTNDTSSMSSHHATMTSHEHFDPSSFFRVPPSSSSSIELFDFSSPPLFANDDPIVVGHDYDTGNDLLINIADNLPRSTLARLASAFSPPPPPEPSGEGESSDRFHPVPPWG